MKYLIIVIILATSFALKLPLHNTFSQVSSLSSFKWDSTKNWKLYKLSKFNQVFRIPVDSLRYLRHKDLSDDSMHIFLLNSKKLEGINPMWQGCYLASYETPDGQLRKVIISHYAGFFYSQPEGIYFQIRSDSQRDWLSYLSQSYINIPVITESK